MSEERRVNGRYYTTKAAEILCIINEDLSKLSDYINKAKVQEWQTTIKSLIDDITVIQDRLFLKTQGGTSWAIEALETVKNLEEAVQKAHSLASEDAIEVIDKALAEVQKVLGGLIEKAKTLIIRMT